MTTASEEFVEQFGEELYNEIFSVLYGDVKSDDVYISDRQQQDAINCTFTGGFSKDCEDWYFEGSDGDWGGSVITSFGKEESHLSKEFTIRTYSPIYPPNCTDEQKKRVDTIFGLKMKTNEWQEAIRDMNYDYHFSPTLFIAHHYRKKAADFGVQITFDTITTD